MSRRRATGTGHEQRGLGAIVEPAEASEMGSMADKRTNGEEKRTRQGEGIQQEYEISRLTARAQIKRVITSRAEPSQVVSRLTFAAHNYGSREMYLSDSSTGLEKQIDVQLP